MAFVPLLGTFSSLAPWVQRGSFCTGKVQRFMQGFGDGDSRDSGVSWDILMPLKSTPVPLELLLSLQKAP